jgi:hypothetical protein
MQALAKTEQHAAISQITTHARVCLGMSLFLYFPFECLFIIVFYLSFFSYDGRDCENDINECLIEFHTCFNGGTCNDLLDDYSCTCTAGWEGAACSSSVNDCILLGDSCENGGVCIDQHQSILCDCSGTGYEGANCTVGIDDCITNNCTNGATCNDQHMGYTCDCETG